MTFIISEKTYLLPFSRYSHF